MECDRRVDVYWCFVVSFSRHQAKFSCLECRGLVVQMGFWVGRRIVGVVVTVDCFNWGESCVSSIRLAWKI